MAKIVKDINSSNRVRHFDVVFYGTVEQLLDIIKIYRERIQRYAFILHDKDVYLDDLKDDNGNFLHRKGDIKKPHIHLVVSFFNACTLRACSRLFTTELDKPRVFSIGDMCLAYDYLIHKNDSDKYQYRKCDILSDDLSYYEKLLIQGEKSESDNKAEQIIIDLLAGVCTRVMVSRYGRDFVIHQSQYRECVSQIRLEDMQEQEKREKIERQRALGLQVVQSSFTEDIF